MADISLLSTNLCMALFNALSFSEDTPCNSGLEISKADWAFNKKLNNKKAIFVEDLKAVLYIKLFEF